VILISHDRDFLDRVVTSVIVNENTTSGAGAWREYPGGYTDMLAQRGFGIGARPAVKTQEKPAKENKASASAPTSGQVSGGKPKLSYKEKYALETLPARMEELSAEINRLQAIMDDPDLYSRDLKKFNKTTGELEAKASELQACEEQWLTLEMLREEIEGA